ncbi:hypothetical protein BAE44_0010825, partial [Dichanthelium oligosanthes]
LALHAGHAAPRSRAPQYPGPGARSLAPPSMRPTVPSPLTPATPCHSSSWPSPSTSRATAFPRCVPSTPRLPRYLPAHSSCTSKGTHLPSAPRSRSCYTATVGSIRLSPEAPRLPPGAPGSLLRDRGPLPCLLPLRHWPPRPRLRSSSRTRQCCPTPVPPTCR